MNNKPIRYNAKIKLILTKDTIRQVKEGIDNKLFFDRNLKQIKTPSALYREIIYWYFLYEDYTKKRFHDIEEYYYNNNKNDIQTTLLIEEEYILKLNGRASYIINNHFSVPRLEDSIIYWSKVNDNENILNVDPFEKFDEINNNEVIKTRESNINKSDIIYNKIIQLLLIGDKENATNLYNKNLEMLKKYPYISHI